MKTKSSYHRSTNTYKFQTFSERISNINIDVIRKGGRTEQQPEDADSFFAAGLAKWTDLNCTQDFGNFTSDISGQVDSFAQLVHHEDEIITALKKHLQKKGSLAHQPLLDLLVQLARDLQTDFYPHFPDFFHIIVSLLNTQDTELLENAFRAFGYLFKFLWRYLVRDIHDVFRLYSPLLADSQRDHIRNFAAESFAFLMRKVKDHDALFNMMLARLEENPDQSTGFGRLFFEMIKGVKTQFHSCTEKVLPILLSKLGPIQAAEESTHQLPWQLVLETLQAAFEFMAEWTSPEHAGVIGNVLKSCVSAMHKLFTAEADTDRKVQIADQLDRLLALTTQWIGHHSGYLIKQPDTYAEVLLMLLEGSILPGQCGDTLLDLTAALLNASQCDIRNDVITHLVRSVFSSHYSQLQVLGFSQQLFSMRSFEKDILHPLLHFCHTGIGSKSTSSNHDILHTLCSLVLHKQSSTTDGSVLESHEPYLMDFSFDVYKSQSKSKKNKKRADNFPEYLLSLLEFSPELLRQDNVVSVLWAALVCLPSTRPLDKARVVPKLKSLITTLGDVAENQKDETVKDMLLYLLSVAVCSLLQCGQGQPMQSLVQEDFVWNILRTNPTCVHALLIGDLYITQLLRDQDGSFLAADKLKLILPALQPNLSSPHKKVRTLTLRILSQFPVKLPTIPDLHTRQVCVFKLCLDAELVPATIEDYREKQKLLQRLSYDAVQPNVPLGEYKEVALRYLIGSLYINFQLLWQPIMEMIKTHVYGMDKKCFWSVYTDHLQKMATLLESSYRETTTNLNLNDSTEVLSPNSDDLSALFRKVQAESVADADRPDHWNVRQLMWKAMAQFADRAEGRSRDLVPLVFRFIENEYHPSNVNNAPTQDIRTKTGLDMSLDQTEDDDENEEDLGAESQEGEEGEDVDETPRRSLKRGRKKIGKGSVYRALVTYLQLFSKFKDPKSMYKEPQLRQLYFDLLSSNFPDIQKVVLSCLMTYNHPYLTPYRDSLEALMEDKKFRETLVQFSIDETTGVVADNHREGLLPILLRILYGKMMSKTGPGTQGKSGGAVRRATILRFIAGSSSSEMSVFLDLVLEPCQLILKDDYRLMMTDFLGSLSPSAVIPLKKQQSMLDTIGVIFSKLGHRIEQFASKILHLVITLLASYAQLLDQRNQIQTYAIGQLKKLRQLALLRLVEFFGIFEQHPLSANEIDCIFEAAVWPQIDSLANECLASPTPLLKLILVWSKNPRFHPLLAKHHPTRPSCTILPSVTALLSASTVSASVVAMVMEIVEQLLTKEDSGIEDGQEVDDDLEVNDLIDVKIEDREFTEPPSYGTKLLFPYVPAVLQYLSSSVSRSTQTKEDRRSLPMKDLNILSKISLYISDPEQSAVLVSLLLPFLRRTNEKHETTELDILHTIRNVIKLCENPADFLGTLSALFYRLTFRQSRAVLCEVFAAMAQSNPDLGDLARLMKQLNSWDRKHIDEPDYAYRLAGFKLANERLAAMATVDIAFVTPIVYNCFYMIMKIEDMSMRDNSAHFLKALLQKLSSQEPNTEHFNGIVIHKYAPAIRDALRLKSENARHEMICLLSDIVQLFPDHPQFQCMRILQDTDIEKDFFENIRHIQHHRRMRALRRLALHARQGDLAYSALYQFLLPMATALIFDQTIAAKNPNLVIEAIGAVGAVAGQLPWRWYYLILQQYLRLVMRSIDQQKTAVRLVVAVLDGFHFDLSLSEGVESVQVGKTSVKPSQDSSEDRGGDNDKSTDEKSNNEGEHKEVVNEKDVDEEDDDEDDDEENEDTAELDSHEDADKLKNNVALATKIHRIIVASILPKLHKTLTNKVKSEEHHKKARYSIADDEEILRVPIALAMVKLLQALPKKTLHRSLPGVLVKVCQMLKSRAKDVRDVSRETLVKILASLGVKYFPFILKELCHALTRGYQLHVLSFTLHALLHSALPTLKPGDLDTSIHSMIEVINKELFGEVADEKEVEGIVGKLVEARSIKGYDSYEMIAKVIGQSSLTQLLIPLKEILEVSHNHKVVRKATDVLKHVTMGLIANPGITVDAMLIYIHGLATETIPFLNPSDSDKAKTKPPDPQAGPESCYLLPPTPKKGGVAPKVSKKTNMHLIVEFGLQLLHMNLKRSKLSPSNQQHLQMLDPFIPILMDSLTSKYTKVTVVALRCITWMLRYPLPSISKSAFRLTKILFKILHTHAMAGAAKGANFDIVVSCFKAVTVLVRDVKQHMIDEKQLQVLLTYAEEDMHDHTRQATAFGLLKAILSRKLIVPEMHDVMKKVAQLSVTSESPSVRLQCRQVVLNFLLDYPLGNKLKRHLEFYVRQLNFDLETGRESSLEMLATIFSSFPQKTLETYAGMFFIPMATRLVNDESAKCRKITALAIRSLLQKLWVEKRDELFTMATHWLHDNNPAHQCLSSQLCGIFVDAEEAGIQRRLDDILPQIQEHIKPDGLQKDGMSAMETDDTSMEERHTDHMLFNLLSALAKMIKHCSIIGNKAYTDTLNAIWDPSNLIFSIRTPGCVWFRPSSLETCLLLNNQTSLPGPC